jgi:hypothetical protein
MGPWPRPRLQVDWIAALSAVLTHLPTGAPPVRGNQLYYDPGSAVRRPSARDPHRADGRLEPPGEWPRHGRMASVCAARGGEGSGIPGAGPWAIVQACIRAVRLTS